MNKRQLRAFEATLRALAFLSQLKTADPEIIDLRERLQASVDKLRASFNDQSYRKLTLGMHGGKIQRLKRELHRDHLLKISRHGKVMLRGLPGIKDELRVPHAHAPVDDLLDAAKRIATAVRPHAKAFRQAKFAPDFVKSLERAANALAREAAIPNDGRAKRSIATRSVKGDLAEARELVAAIDSSIMSYFHKDRLTTGSWRLAKRIGAPIGRPKKRSVKA